MNYISTIIIVVLLYLRIVCKSGYHPFLKEPDVKLILPFLNHYEDLEDLSFIEKENTIVYINTIGCKSFTKERKRKRRNATKSKKANRR